jgi:hypothetical protein
MVELSGRTVVAAFKHRAQAQRAVDALLDAGFADALISIEATEEWRHHEGEAADDAAPLAAPSQGLAPARWPVPAGAFLGGAVAAGAAMVAQRRRSWWQRGGWTRGQIALVAAGAFVGAAGGLALLTGWRGDDGSAGPDGRGRAEYDQGSLERGHAIVTVAPGERLADAESLLRAFGGRGVHVRAPEPVEEPGPSPVEATVRMETLS